MAPATNKWLFSLGWINLAVAPVLLIEVADGQITSLAGLLHLWAYCLVYANLTGILGMLVLWVKEVAPARRVAQIKTDRQKPYRADRGSRSGARVQEVGRLLAGGKTASRNQSVTFGRWLFSAAFQPMRPRLASLAGERWLREPCPARADFSVQRAPHTVNLRV